ncbi:MAG TPA: GNAT family N-acetyltransferase [Candidatus Limnocylindria bacterium]|nr:GNAT family N-acetyltransferase [Candidatus Limnocylindria bacterium]
MTHPEQTVLERLETYYDAVPRTAADPQPCGPFTLFVSREDWPYYARPSRGLTRGVTVEDVRTLSARQRELGLPESIEWVGVTTPTLEAAALGAGLTVHHFPLMTLGRDAPVPAQVVGSVRLLRADDHDLSGAVAAVHRGFGAEELPSADEIDAVRRRVRDGLQVTVGAFDASGTAVGGGFHQPVGDVTELVGIAVVPEARRQGYGAAITAALVADAVARSVDLVFLSASDESVARTYARVGFNQIATVSAAEPAAAPSPPP